MSRLNIALILILTGMLAFVQIRNASAEGTTSKEEAVVKLTPTATPTPTPTPIPVGVPLTIQLPKIQIYAPVEPVGVDFQGKMNMPEDWGKTAWYSGGGAVKPGEPGNAVIAGHLDTVFGTLGQFYYLSTLLPGDEVYVNDDIGRTYRFVVTDKQTYEYNQVPLELVFGASAEKHLNLITCTGIYINGNYSHRLVVFTKLVE